MTSLNLFSSSNYKSLQQDFDTLNKVNTRCGDKLAVKDGRLVISKGGFLQAPTRTLKDMRFGGYNREAVTVHLEQLCKKTKAFIEDFQKNPGYLNFGSEYKNLVDRLDNVSTAVSDVQYSYREIKATPASKDSTCPRLSNVFDVFYQLHKGAEKSLKNKPWKFLLPEQKAPLDYDAPVDLKKILKMKAEDYTPEEILKLAEGAARQKIPLWKKVGACALFGFGGIVMLLPIGIATNVKWIFWNPVEYALKGRITTQNPTLWWIHTWSSWLFSKINDDSESAINWYAHMLLRAQKPTDAHVEAFCKLAPHVKNVETYFCNEISHQNLQKIIEAVGKSARCRKIELGSISQVQNKDIQSLLAKYGFKQNGWEYTR